ncbi:MAG: hypothetical protein K2X50_03830 [Gammaproteobacteria bacterium]|nr:hypothetical protein [Gammaproteobacteria bacterium]
MFCHSSKVRNLIVSASLCGFVCSSASAIKIPGSVAPGRIQHEVVPLHRPLPATQIHYADFPLVRIDWHQEKKSPARLQNVIVKNQETDFSAQLEIINGRYLGLPMTLNNVTQLATELGQFYRQHGFFAAQVVVPQQHRRHGVLEVVVYEGAISDVQITNKKTSANILQRYAHKLKKLSPLNRADVERKILLMGEISGVTLTADIAPDSQHPGCAKVTLNSEFKQVGIDLGYDNYGVRWEGPHQYSANVFGNSLFQLGDHSHVNTLMSSDGSEMRFLAVEHDMPLGYAGTRLKIWGNYTRNEPEFTLSHFDFDGRAVSAGIFARHPFILSVTQQLWARLGVRFTDEEVKLQHKHYYVDKVRVLEASTNYIFNDCWKGQAVAQVGASHGFDVLGAEDIERSWHSLGKGVDDFTKINGEVSYTRPLVDQFSLMVGGQGQYAFNPLVVSELLSVGGRYWGRAYDWAEIMGDSGVVGTAELRYDTKPGAPEHKNAQYFLAYDAGAVWARYAHHHRQSLTSLQAGVRFDFTRYLSADLVIAKPLTRKVLAEELADHHGDRFRAFFRIALHA